MAILKWLGNKQNLLPTLTRLFDPKATTLVEPFLGGCSLLTNTNFERYRLSDINPDLINVYRQCSSQPDTVLGELDKLYTQNSADEYYQIRNQFNTSERDTTTAAARFIYLNRWGFRGLCRYNQSGEFNSPYGHYQSAYFPKTDIVSLAERCREVDVEFTCCGWREALGGLVPGETQVYLDPPYLPISDTANFANYHTEGFGWEEHLALSESVLELDSQGIAVVVSNSACERSGSLYGDLRKVVLTVNRSIAGSKGSANTVEEFVVFNTHRELLD